jgi:SAM-dependent methyltransferase
MDRNANLWLGVGEQLRRPRGRGGRLIGRVMALANREPNRLAIEALGVANSDIVLELGFGPGGGIKALTALATQGAVLGVDQSPEMLAQASRTNRRAVDVGQARLILGRFDELPLLSEGVDKILAVNVVYFFSETAREITEMKRVLCPGGTAVIYATDKATMAHWKFAGSDTHMLFDEEGLYDFILRGGFTADEVSIQKVCLSFGVKGLIATLRKQRPHG